MLVCIRNLTQRPVIVRCNSGEALHLAPGIVSAAIPDAEVRDNPKIRKLISRCVIVLQEAEVTAPTGKAKREMPKEKKKAKATRYRK
ncbi:hypothetical protein [Syntrophorhabdus aromaticivorans]|jgi:hypothetical protein|uniref:Uncharacterized protein n=1 Tax=Syntrophorhabdus aromaticivorans TaxID=328301 RepID=A0A971M6F2_9BACT|nr:hypothetical protein [Syntrophorhabdus aromaticivorans]NLW36189.1 hypothetical protein [Syntrophorhabdus aromaticivorans]